MSVPGDQGPPGETRREKRIWTIAAIVLYLAIAVGAARVLWRYVLN